MAVSESKKIEAGNLEEEIQDILENCIKCGMCKSLCPVFKVLREEEYSPRGKAILLSKKIVEDFVFKCNLCKACEWNCPLDLRICEAVIKARESMNLYGKELKDNKEMMRHIKKKGNPFGENPEKCKKLYCC